MAELLWFSPQAIASRAANAKRGNCLSSEFAIGLAVVAALLGLISMRRVKALNARVETLEAQLKRDRPTAPEATPKAGADAGIEAGTGADTAADTEPQTESETGKAAKPGGWSPRTPKMGAAMAGFGGWVRANWIYPVAGAALVMAAIFLVQYSIERGLLSPQTRIGLALALGAALIGAGEGIRRRWGDEASAAQMIPSTLSGAGIAALLAAVLAAFHLYAMMSQTTALLALAAICGLAMVLGWLHGPLLAAIGILAGSAAPFLLGAGDTPPDLLYAYFGMVGVLGLGIDGFRRWGWVSLLAVAAPMSGAYLIALSGAGALGFAGFVVVITLLSMALPFGAIVPLAQGRMLSQRRSGPVEAGVYAAALASVLGTLMLVGQGSPILTSVAIGTLALLHPVWTRNAPALADLALVPVLGVPATLFVSMPTAPLALAGAGIGGPASPLAVVALTALAGGAMIWRSQAETGALRSFWALAGIGFPGATMVAFELFWALSTRIDSGQWAITAMALATGYAALALWAARRDGGQGLRLGAAAAASFAMIALALMLTISLTALTAALAVLMIAAAALDRRFNIPMLGWFQVLGAMAISWRIVLDPGISWLVGFADTGGASTLDVWLSLTAALAGPGLAFWILRPLARNTLRDWAVIFVETAFYGLIPIALAIILAKIVGDGISSHANLGLQGTVLIALSWVQSQRAARFSDATGLRVLRILMAVLFGAAAALALLAGVFLFSPIAPSSYLASSVRGWPVLNDLLVAYAVPGAVLLWILRDGATRRAALGRLLGAGLLVFWIGTLVRHLWQGDDGMSLRNGFEQGELYAYTVALLIGGATALALALRLGRTALRIAGLVLIAIATAKAFLIDAAGLTGLLRVGAFLGLGLSLAGLAWLNAWVERRMVEDPADP